MITWIASYPRSGNTFFRILLHRCYGIQSAEVEATRIQRRRKLHMEELGHVLQTHALDSELAEAAERYFVKTHSPPTELTSPAIYLVRDGRDSLVSAAWLNLTRFQGIPKEQVDTARFNRTLFDLMIARDSPFATWSENVLAWLNRPNTVIVRFEELVSDPRACLESVGDRLSLGPISSEVSIPTFEELNAQYPYFFRRGVVGSWRDEFPEGFKGLFAELHGEAMSRLGYALDAHSQSTECSSLERQHWLNYYGHFLTGNQRILEQQQELKSMDATIRALQAKLAQSQPRSWFSRRRHSA